ncbi:MAG: hypothetical protein LAN62_07225 [Acidobacteriia bacterium]|nr:hypothetical protein [Terriglobia bacterium]
MRGLDVETLQGVTPVDRADRSKVPALPAGHYSLLLRAVFQSSDHTLTSEEVAEASRRVLAALEPLGIRLRG